MPNQSSYWRNLTSVLIGSACLLIYDVAERGMQLLNPFFSIWSSELGSRLAVCFHLFSSIFKWQPFQIFFRDEIHVTYTYKFQYTSIYVASLCVLFYFGFLTYKVYRVWKTIKVKRSAQLYRNNEIRRLKVCCWFIFPASKRVLW